MGFWKVFFSAIFMIIVAGLLIMYWFVPYRNIQLNAVPEEYQGNNNFSLINIESEGMQFYQNMRYPESRISYKFSKCSLKKKNNMQRAFEIIEEKTTLNFYEVPSEERITISCSEKVKMDRKEEFFIAGEGGPTKIIRTEKFNVIFGGEILLIDESKCEKPNVAIHELLHALGLKHSKNPNNIMYNITRCQQTIGDDTINLLNELYSIPSHPDLKINNVSASIKGKYLNTNATISNNGLKTSDRAKLIISTNKGVVKEINIEPFQIGHGKTIYWKNLWIEERNYDYLKYEIQSSQQELDKKNNKIKLKIKE